MACNKYQGALIYTIKTDNGLYVGSTCNFARRKTNHKSNCFNENDKKVYDYKVYKNIRENGGEYAIEIYKLFPCNNSNELRIEEENVRTQLNANLNDKKCFNSITEIKQYHRKYKSDNREKNIQKIKLSQHNSYIKNKEIISKKMSEKITCECGCQIARRNISTHRKSNKHINLINQVI